NGKVSGLNRAQLSGKELTGMLEAKSAGKDFVTIPVQPDGQFSIPDLIFYDTAKLYYQFTNDKEKRLTTLGVFSFRSTLMGEPLQTKPDLAKFPLPEQADSLVAKNDVLSQRRRIQDEEQRKVQTLAAVEVRAKQKSQAEKMEEDYTSGLFRGGNAHTFILEGDPRAMSSTSVLQYLQGKVAGLQISGNLANPSVTWRFGTPTIFLNEMQQDVAFLQSIPMTDVAMIKVFNPPFVGGSAGGGASGAIAVYTKKGGSTEEVKGLSSTTVIGYSPIKEFYSPDYSKEGEAHDLADYRTTLLWEPFVLTDKNKRRILLTFYNNDVTRRIRVVVEGFDVDGKLTRIEKVFE
ncbi:MAG TPA: hypothetical protein VD996_13755, partial [Chitinophagaceae bacterium]|nr:hypothetical protein [Chitinophagaceae bacterium]